MLVVLFRILQIPCCDYAILYSPPQTLFKLLKAPRLYSALQGVAKTSGEIPCWVPRFIAILAGP